MPEHEKTRATVNQIKTSRYRLGRKYQNKCSVFAKLRTLSQQKKKRYTQIYANVSPPLQVGKKYIYVMYV